MAAFAGRSDDEESASGTSGGNQKRQRTALRLICRLLVGGIIPEPRKFMKIMRSITGATLVSTTTVRFCIIWRVRKESLTKRVATRTGAANARTQGSA